MQKIFTPCLISCRLSATLLVLNLQSSFNVPNVHTDALLSLLSSEMLPQPNTLPQSHAEAKKVLKEVGMEYQIIHCCTNGCSLYRKELEHATSCATCGTNRYRDDTLGKKIPQKVYMHKSIICMMNIHIICLILCYLEMLCLYQLTLLIC